MGLVNIAVLLAQHICFAIVEGQYRYCLHLGAVPQRYEPDLAPSTFHWLLMAINQLLPSVLLSRLRDEDKKWAEADKLLGGTSKKVKGKFRKFAH